MAWAQEGITSVAMAKEANSRYAKEYYTILKTMGISNRNPIDTEVSFMNTWLHDYGFTMDIIQEACSRTVLQTGQPSFQYADKILSGWKHKSVKNIEDIRRLDAQHKQRKLEKVGSKAAPDSKNLPIITVSIISTRGNMISMNMKKAAESLKYNKQQAA